MDCSHDKNYERLIKVSKVFSPTLLIICYIFYQSYRYSVDTFEVYVISKNVTWIEYCDENNCIESPVFNVITKGELFTTTEALFNQITIKNNYFISVKGWEWFGARRKLTQIY